MFANSTEHLESDVAASTHIVDFDAAGRTSNPTNSNRSKQHPSIDLLMDIRAPEILIPQSVTSDEVCVQFLQFLKQADMLVTSRLV